MFPSMELPCPATRTIKQATRSIDKAKSQPAVDCRIAPTGHMSDLIARKRERERRKKTTGEGHVYEIDVFE